MPIDVKQFAVLLTSASLALLLPPGEAKAGELSTQESRTFEMQEVSLWLKARFSEAELEALGPEASRVEAHSCGCYDEPRPHFPYRLVLFTTPKGDLVARAESHESALRITPLAVRKGNHYYELESEEQSYGAFAHPCDFTDFRYGPHLREFFPSCKAAEKRTGFPLPVARND
jgi:hypothetical protein